MLTTYNNNTKVKVSLSQQKW